MEIIVGKTAGFCYGVKNAVSGAIKEASKTDKQIFCLGEIVHNKQVINKLETLGIKCIETLEQSEGTTLIRAHGVPKEIYEKANEMNIKIKDYTCPNVLKIHQIAEKFNKNGYYIFLVGSKNHPENIGTLSYCGENYFIFEDEEEINDAIKTLEQSDINKVVLIAQTTYSIKKFEKIEKIIKQKIKNKYIFEVQNTICKATELRQKETEGISKKVDFMIIIGGKNSSNTKKLYEVAKDNCKNTVLIETVDDLKIEGKIKKIGIMAGASTPQESIEEVIENVKKNNFKVHF